MRRSSRESRVASTVAGVGDGRVVPHAGAADSGHLHAGDETGTPLAVAPPRSAGHSVRDPADAGPSGDRVLGIALILALSAFVLMIVWLLAR